jgi:hypothetical protein
MSLYIVQIVPISSPSRIFRPPREMLDLILIAYCYSLTHVNIVCQDGPFVWSSKQQGAILSAYFIGYFLTQVSYKYFFCQQRNAMTTFRENAKTTVPNIR